MSVWSKLGYAVVFALLSALFTVIFFGIFFAIAVAIILHNNPYIVELATTSSSQAAVVALLLVLLGTIIQTVRAKKWGWSLAWSILVGLVAALIQAVTIHPI